MKKLNDLVQIDMPLGLQSFKKKIKKKMIQLLQIKNLNINIKIKVTGNIRTEI